MTKNLVLATAPTPYSWLGVLSCITAHLPQQNKYYYYFSTLPLTIIPVFAHLCFLVKPLYP